MGAELAEIHPNLIFSSSIEADLPLFIGFDFIVTCGSFELSEYLIINEKSRSLNICNSWCFEYGGKFMIFNDFIEFTVKPANNDSKTVSFPSFKHVICERPNESCKNSLLNSFHNFLQSNVYFK